MQTTNTVPLEQQAQQQPLAPLDTTVPATAGPTTASSVPASMSAKDAKSLKKELEKEGKHEDSTIKKQVKEISHAEKAERRAVKSDSSALKAQTKAESHLHSANKELERAQAKHDAAIREMEKAKKEVEIKNQHHGQVTTNLQNAKAQLDNLTHNREAHHAEREAKIHQLEQIIDQK